MTIVRANVGGLGLLPEGGAAPPECSGGRFALPWRAICLFAFWGTFASTLVAVAWLSLIPRQYSFDTGAARQIWRLGTRVYEAQFAGRLPPGCLVGCSGLQLTKAASAEEVTREPGRFWIDAEHGIVRWSHGRSECLLTSSGRNCSHSRFDLLFKRALESAHS